MQTTHSPSWGDTTPSWTPATPWLRLEEYDFTLPQERIAQHPHHPADECKLLIYRPNGWIQDKIFKDIAWWLTANDVILCNDSRVIKARIHLTQPWKGEIFYLRPATWDNTCEALISPWKKFRVGTSRSSGELKTTITVLDTTKEGRILHSTRPRADLLQEHGTMPLPPYVTYSDSAAVHYQSLFAKNAWSVAAPTASLHFTQPLIDRLIEQWTSFHATTLHIGLWTFQRVEANDITQHPIHDETINLNRWLREVIADEKKTWKHHTAVWTTVMRTLESMPYLRVVMRHAIHNQLSPSTIQRRDHHTATIDPKTAMRYIPSWSMSQEGISAATELFLHPGIPTRLCDGLITNFHLPKSSLLMLVAAFVWYETMRTLYDHAQQESYMFYSFGDAMRLDLRHHQYS
jgi:S-adenosylmethionine:tRNA ribosyltransferase-isomerase